MKLHTIIKTFTTPFFAIVMASILMVSTAQAECNFFRGWVDNKDGTVRDPRNGLIWKRCAEGFEFSNGVCAGAGVQAIWDGAKLLAQQSRFLGQSDWRLPSQEEFKAVMGSRDECENNDWKNGEYAASKAIAHSGVMMSGTMVFWSSSPNVYISTYAWFADFGDGQVSGRLDRNYRGGVRLVRASQLLGGEAALEFAKSKADWLAANELRLQAEARERTEEETRQKELAQQRAVEMEKQRIADEAEARQRAAEERQRQIEEAKERKKQEIEQAQERKKLAAFRKSLREGDDTNCGPIIEVKGKLVKVAFAVANYGNEHWIKRDQILSTEYGCRFVNGQYQSE